MSDPKKVKKDECNPFEKCVKNKKFESGAHKRHEHNENVPGAKTVVQPKYEEKFAYVHKEEATPDKDSGTERVIKQEEHLMKSDRDAKFKGLKKQY
jgi:hypothetical protein